ncbi:MAG: ATP-dependent Clp protease ATP-binding subunit [Planctomycetes bacterium]|nr:ATP-dependent Clp protease ATP-binding subunit [Planctomycetota bacterium]
MANLPFQLHALVQRLENDQYIGEALFVPEISRFGQSALRVRRALAGNARRVLERDAPGELYRRASAGAPEVREFTVELPPARELTLWRGPLTLTFHAACWSHGTTELAFLPALGIEVIADNRTELEARVPREILLHIQRTHLNESWGRLLLVQRCLELQTFPLPLEPEIQSPKEREVQSAQGSPKSSVLREIGIELASARLDPAFERDEDVRRLAGALAEPAPESVLLVGPSGVGKTAVFHELVRRRAELHFPVTPFWATSGSRLVAGMSGFGMWQQRCDDLRREAARTRAIIHLGNLVELMEVGKGMMIQQGVAGFLRPFIARGELQCVVECTPEQLPHIERRDPHLLGAFKRIVIDEPTPQAALSILLSVAHELSPDGRDQISMESLETLDRLHRRYATYSAYPGRPLRFLKNLLTDRAADAHTPTDEAAVYEAFSRETGMPRVLLDTAIALEPTQTQRFFAERVMGQDGALALVTDLLATIKAGMARPRRPLASYLFAGPTGVGKTETAKALAEYMFHDPRRITRFDMSEYASAGAVARLIGGDFGEEGLLTARLREQPFCVLLFDEFEKAHPAFFDLLLQVLGEARLTDAAGRLADFRNAVVIMTSNLGAESFMQGGLGFAPGNVDAREHFTRALEKFVRPELINRIDRVVPFLPLPPEVVLRIVGRELEQIRRRPGLLATGTALSVDGAVAAHIAQVAYQPAMGARPLKREVARSLLAPLAEALNTQSTVYALDTHAVMDGAVRVLAKPLDEGDGPRARRSHDHALGALASEVGALRRKAQKANKSPALLAVRNAILRLERALDLEARRMRKKDYKPAADKSLSELPGLQAIDQAFAEALEQLNTLEDRLLLGAFGREPSDEAALRARAREVATLWEAALRALMRLGLRTADAATMWVYSHNNDLMFDLARAYLAWAQGSDIKCVAYWAAKAHTEQDFSDLRNREQHNEVARDCLLRELKRNRETLPSLYAPRDSETFLAEPREDRGAIVLSFSGPDVLLSLRGEQGLHRFRHDAESEPVNVDVRVFSEDPFQAELPLPRGATEEGDVRRRYELAQRQAHDTVLDIIAPWTGRALELALGRCMDATFLRALERQVGL